MADLAFRKTKAYLEIDRMHQDILIELTDDVTPEERDTWFLKEEPAMLFLAGNTTDPRVQMFLVETTITGDDPTVFSNYILKKSGEFRYLASVASGLKTKGKRAVEAATSVEVLAATMDAIHAQADASVLDIKSART